VGRTAFPKFFFFQKFFLFFPEIFLKFFLFFHKISSHFSSHFSAHFSAHFFPTIFFQQFFSDNFSFFSCFFSPAFFRLGSAKIFFFLPAAFCFFFRFSRFNGSALSPNPQISPKTSLFIDLLTYYPLLHTIQLSFRKDSRPKNPNKPPNHVL